MALVCFRHVHSQSCYQLDAFLKKRIEEFLWDIAFICKLLTIQTFSQHIEYRWIFVANVCTSKYKGYYLASVIARKVELKAMAPTHCSLSVCGNVFEHFAGISPEIMAYCYHGWINKGYTCTSAKSTEIKEEHELEEHAAFQLHKAVVWHGFRKIRLHRTLNEEQIVVLEIAECTKIQQNGHDFTVGQRRLAPSTLDSAIVFK